MASSKSNLLNFWETEETPEGLPDKWHKHLAMRNYARFGKSKLFRAWTYTFGYIFILLFFLWFAIYFVLNFSSLRGVYRGILIILGLVISFLPIVGWWETSYQFEYWLSKITEKVIKNQLALTLSDKQQIRQQKRMLSVHKEFALGLWLVGLVIFGIFIVQGSFYPEITFNPSYRREVRYVKCHPSTPVNLYKTPALLEASSRTLEETDRVILTGLLGEGIAQIEKEQGRWRGGWIKAKNLTVEPPSCSE